jgi:hypothetical protein
MADREQQSGQGARPGPSHVDEAQSGTYQDSPGFTGGEDLSGRGEFAGRPNATEERMKSGLRPEDDERQARDPAR